MSDYDDGGINGIHVDQQIRQLSAQETLDRSAGVPAWWVLPALIVFIAVLIQANVWLSRRGCRERRQ